MQVLVGCEYSGIVRSAFEAAGHDAMSCDLLPSELPGKHYQGDIFEVLSSDFDLIILHPPCTALAVSGNRWYSGTKERKKAIEWTLRLWNEPRQCARRVAMENPVGVLSVKASQYIQP